MINRLVFFGWIFLIQGCLTVESGSGKWPTDDSLRSPTRERVRLDFRLEAVDAFGNRTIFAPESSKTLRQDLVEVLEEKGFEVVDSGSDTVIISKLEILNDDCDLLFIKAHCLATAITAGATLYLIPVTIHTKLVVTTEVKTKNQPTQKWSDTGRTSTWFHLLLLPALPYEWIVMPNGRAHQQIYAAIMSEYLRTQMSAKSDS